MKNLILLISTVAFLFVLPTNTMSSVHNKSAEDSIQVWTNPELYNISTIWVSEYVKNHPQANIRVSVIPEGNLRNTLKTSGSIGLITPDLLSDTDASSIWKMAVGRDIIVPVMNVKNPYIDEIYSKGISSGEFTDAYSVGGKQSWGTLLNNDLSSPLNCYCIEDESIRSHLTDFLQTDLTDMHGRNVANVDEMLEKIKNDRFAIGFCRLVDILNYENQEVKEGFSLIPIDINENNKVDYFEDIYNNSFEFERAVWIGKYPKLLFSNIFTVATDQPVNDEELAFIEWLATEGQQYLYASGYSELLYSERQAKVQNLYAEQLPIAGIQQKPVRSNNFLSGVLLITIVTLLGLTIIFTLSTIIYEVVQLIKVHIFDKLEVEVEKVRLPSFFGENSIKIPGGLFFDKSHTWAFMEKNGFVRIGIDDFLQHVTGPITKIKMKHPGESVTKGEAFLSLVQHGKQLNIKSPVSGIIKENNDKLKSNSSMINSDPYSDGWVYVIESGNWLKDTKVFLMGETYKIWLKNEFSRLKDFISSVVKPEEDKHLQYVMQDGGELKDSLLEMLGPEIWEEFQSEFINHSK